MDDNKVFDDKPLNDVAGDGAKPSVNFSKSTQIPVADDQPPKDIWDDQPDGPSSDGPDINSGSEANNKSESGSIDNIDEISPNRDSKDFADYYRQAQNQQINSSGDVDDSGSQASNSTPISIAAVSAPVSGAGYATASYNVKVPEIDLVPESQQTYEQAEASARIANQNMQVKKKSKLKGVIVGLIIFLILIAGLVGGYFYLKLINTPQYILNQAFGNFSKQKSDTSFSYQVKKGSVYEDVLTISDKSDANNNIENEINFKPGNLETKLNIVSQSGKYYFKLNGLEAASQELKGSSESLSATVKSAGLVLDDQWVELDQINKFEMPSTILKQLYPLVSAVDKNSITEVSRSGDVITYSFNLDAAKVESIITDTYNTKVPDALKQYNLKIEDYLKPEQIAKLNYKVMVSKNQKTVSKLVISTDQEDVVLNFNFSIHSNQKLSVPTQSKKFSEVAGELEAATSQNGVNIGPLLKGN